MDDITFRSSPIRDSQIDTDPFFLTASIGRRKVAPSTPAVSGILAIPIG
jgi:hypothetical protein